MLTKPQVRAILDKHTVLEKGHFRLPDGRHTSHAAFPMRVLQHAEYAASLAQTLGTAYRATRPHVVLASTMDGALLGYELSRALRARVVLAFPDGDGRLALDPGQAIEPGERVLIAEAQITDPRSLDRMIAFASGFGAEVIGVAGLVDRVGDAWAGAVHLEALLRLESSGVSPEACPLCQAGKSLDTPGRKAAS